MNSSLQYSAARESGLDQRSLALAELPPANNTRWIARRKAQVVAAVHSGLLSLDDACTRYALSLEEFMDWQIMAGRNSLKKLHNPGRDNVSGVRKRIGLEAPTSMSPSR